MDKFILITDAKTRAIDPNDATRGLHAYAIKTCPVSFSARLATILGGHYLPFD
jgi:hypothetical protein